MNILIEGPDASGKSTLVQEILREFPYLTHWHLTSSTPDVTEGIKFYENKLNCIFDRGIISTLVYSEIFKDTIKPTFSDVLWVLNRMDYIIFCIPQNKEKYLEHFQTISKERHEDYKNMTRVYDKFNRIYKQLKLLNYFNCSRFDIFRNAEKTQETQERIINELKCL